MASLLLIRVTRKAEPVLRTELPYINHLEQHLKHKTILERCARLIFWLIPESSFNLRSFFTFMSEVAYIDYS
jgi:hypothetical protein